MIRCLESDPGIYLVPHAIFWRPIRYFSTIIREDEDNLDMFHVASFAIGNACHFDLRTYRGHPEFTVTLYLPFDLAELAEIESMVGVVVEALALPASAIAWKRGESFLDGKVERRSGDYLREAEARILALKIAAQCNNRFASTEFLKKAVPRYTDLSARDLEFSKSRKNERRWQQIVGNVVSHQNTTKGPFKLGYAQRTVNGMRVTDEGLSYLNNMGFSV